jgi:2'-5' RNA ligase
LSTTETSYRIFIGAFLAGDLADRVQALRMRWDPKTAKITPPHVTLAGTYERRGIPSPASEAEAITRLGGLHQLIPPFELVMAGIRTFPPADQPVIYLGIEPTPELLAARQALLGFLGPDKHRRFNPHLTLAMRLQGEPLRKALAYFQNSDWATRRLTFTVSELRMMQRGPSDAYWRCVANFPLNGSGRPGPCPQS